MVPQTWTQATKIARTASASIVNFAVSVPIVADAIAVTFAVESTMLVNAAEARGGATATVPAAAEIVDFESVAVRRLASMWRGLASCPEAPQYFEARLDCRDAVAATITGGNATATKLQRFDAIKLHSVVSENNSLHLQDPGAKMLC